ncbi:N-acetylmuramoyl-L-alanine amidase [Corallococcus sp. CA054B]|uniref:peptidoglycan recognition protein family protein n=1 Tax=Corallococcus sp. CA054B TaxID=2316734 RepID=UPI000EA1F54F|nr:peptidoglycan recognition family protein [Corallococcus sp. CA054B]RKG69913.1 N-acetylmuramoyl-L-alanine amidase [Corallococcus sp. CA054B]
MSQHPGKSSLVQVPPPQRWIGRIRPFSARVHKRPHKSPKGQINDVVVDLNKGTRVTVIGKEGANLHIQAIQGGKAYNGYLSQELVEYVSSSASGFEEALATKDWPAAAKHLGTLQENEIRDLLRSCSARELAYLTLGALSSVPGPYQRVIKVIEKLSFPAAVAGTRLWSAQCDLESAQAEFQVKVISRDAWGALPPDKSQGWDEYPPDAALPLTRIVVHHTADPLEQTVKELESKERDEDYADMPYHFVITMNGEIYEGRSIHVVGAHAGAFKNNKDIKRDPDYGAIGIVLTGDFESRKENLWMPDRPTYRQIASLQRLLNHLVLKYGLSPDSILKHSEVKRDGKPKVCPGEHLSPHVDSGRFVVRQALKKLKAAKEDFQAAEQHASTLKLK